MKINFKQRIDSIDRIRSAVVFLVLAAILMIYSGLGFMKMHKPDPLYPSTAVTSKAKLGDYYAPISGTMGDSDIFFMKGAQPGAKVLVLGGTHNDEPSGQLSAITLLENAHVDVGELIIIPRTNNSGSTFIQEMNAEPYYVELEVADGIRRIRTGSRYANAAFQFPDPDVFVNVGGAHYPGVEVRDINRVYPGRDGGWDVEQAAHALIEFINTEQIDLVIDLHEAVPEHYVVNCLIGHDRAMELVAMATMGLLMQGIDINMYDSPLVPGFSHRSIGDNTNALVVLAETTNILQGAFRGKPDQQLLHDGKDPFYDILAAKEKIYVEYDSSVGVTLSERVGRHLTTVMELVRNLPFVLPDKAIEISGVPEIEALREKGVEYYLDPSIDRSMSL